VSRRAEVLGSADTSHNLQEMQRRLSNGA
jgi:hypothetical protein